MKTISRIGTISIFFYLNHMDFFPENEVLLSGLKAVTGSSEALIIDILIF